MKHFKWPFVMVLGLLAIFFALRFLEPQPDRLGISGQEWPSPQTLPEFSLQDGDGKVFNNSDLNGKWSVVFFGFSRCTSTCPMVMGYFKNEMARLSPEARQRLQFTMVSVDPEYDKPDILKAFVQGFDPAIRGVTGTQEQLTRLAAGFQSGFAKEQQDPKDINVYMMAHSPKFFLVDPEGHWRGVYEPPLAPGVLAEDLERILKSHGLSKPVS